MGDITNDLANYAQIKNLKENRIQNETLKITRIENDMNNKLQNNLEIINNRRVNDYKIAWQKLEILLINNLDFITFNSYERNKISYTEIKSDLIGCDYRKLTILYKKYQNELDRLNKNKNNYKLITSIIVILISTFVVLFSLINTQNTNEENERKKQSELDANKLHEELKQKEEQRSNELIKENLNNPDPNENSSDIDYDN